MKSLYFLDNYIYIYRVIFEADPSVIAGRVAMKGADNDVPLSEQTISQALQTAKEQIARSLLKS